MQLELERGHHAEVAATTPDGPEQVGVHCRRRRWTSSAVGRDHVRGDQVVTVRSEFAA